MLRSYSLDAILQLDRDTSDALAAIREWRNSFVPINRIPSEVLSLIPTHSYFKDRVRATFVCRHWRRFFLQYGVLWSKLLLRNGEAYVKTILERVEGSELDIVIDKDIPVDRMLTLLSPHARQIRYLKFTQNSWPDLIKFSLINSSGSLPLLRTLELDPWGPINRGGEGPDAINLPPIFGNAVNVETLALCLGGLKPLSSFAFPYLTTFNLTASPEYHCNASDLFNFLKASPMLRTVKIWIIGAIVPRDTPREPVVVLPNVDNFHMHVSESDNICDIPVRISCPCSRVTSLGYRPRTALTPILFPPHTLLNAVVRQYTRSPVEEVMFEVVGDVCDSIAKCFLAFRSSDTSVVRFHFKMDTFDFRWFCHEALLQASRIIRIQPLLSHLKRLHIKYWAAISDPKEIEHVAGEFGRLLESMGPLDELTIHGCDLHVYLAPFLPPEVLGYLSQPIKFPSIKKLAVLYPEMKINRDECINAVLELAKSQHAKGVPFERVTVRAKFLIPTMMEERLMQWVGEVVCSGYPPL